MDAPTSREVAMIVDGLREVKDSITTLSRDMNAKMAVLVSQREFDRTRDDLTIDIGEIRGQVAAGLRKHDEDIDGVREAAATQVHALKEELEKAEARRRTERWAALGAFLTIVGLALTVILNYR